MPRRNVVPLPTGLTAVQGAVMGTAWLTAYRMLFTKSGLRPGQTMLVQGASGGVSTALVQLGRAAGMRVWVTGRSDEKRALAERLGRARHVRLRRAAARAGSTRCSRPSARPPGRTRCARCKPGGVIVGLRLDQRPQPGRRPAAAVLPPDASDRVHNGHSRRARGPARASWPTPASPGDRARAADGTGRGGLPRDARRGHRREDRFHSLIPPGAASYAVRRANSANRRATFARSSMYIQ